MFSRTERAADVLRKLIETCMGSGHRPNYPCHRQSQNPSNEPHIRSRHDVLVTTLPAITPAIGNHAPIPQKDQSMFHFPAPSNHSLSTFGSTMSSFEIASFVGIEHFVVMRHIRRVLHKRFSRDICSACERDIIASNGRTVPTFVIPEPVIEALISEYSYGVYDGLLEYWRLLKATRTMTPADNSSMLNTALSYLIETQKLTTLQTIRKASEQSSPKFEDSWPLQGKAITRYARLLKCVNPNKTKSDLVAAGYLRKSNGVYYVKAKFRYDTFIEKVSPYSGRLQIVLGPKGGEVLQRLHASGQLSLYSAAEFA